MGNIADNLELKAKQILKQVRMQIKEAAGNNQDDWFSVNRYVYARLQLDERKGKPSKIELFDKQKGICPICNERIENMKDTDRHRVRTELGYEDANNIVLVHRSCHQQMQKK